MTQDLTRGNPAKVILLYSLPIILGNVFQQVYNLVDTIIVGRYIGFQALAGVGITGGLNFLVLGFAFGITGGLGIMIAQYFGAKDYEKMRQSIGTSLTICLGLSALLTALAVGLLHQLLQLINTPSSIYDFAHDYIFVIFAGIFATVAYNMVSCILRAIGDSKTPLYFLVFSSVLNVGLDMLCIVVLHWGVVGAATATVVSQLVSAVLCFAYAFRKYPEIRLKRKDFRTNWPFIWEHLRIGLPLALQFSITAFGIVILQSALCGFKDTYIAGFSAASRVQALGSTVGVSFGVAMANYAGQNFGAGDIKRIRSGVNWTILIALCVCAFVSTIMSVFADGLTSMFMDKSAVSDSVERTAEIYYASRRYLYTSAIFFPFLYILFVYRNALQGIGKTFWPLMAGVFELIIRVSASAILPARMGYPAIPLVDVFAWVGACTVLAISYYLQMPKPIKIHNNSTSNKS